MKALILAVAGGFFASALMWVGVYLRPEHMGSGLREFFKWTLEARDKGSIVFAEITASLIGAMTFLFVFG